MGIETLSAQAPTVAFRAAVVNESSLGNLVGQLTQNALVVLVGIVLLMGIAWLFGIWNACAELNKKTKNAHKPSLSIILCLAAGLSVFGSSCTLAQQARAADIQAARTSEGGHCACHASSDNRPYATGYAEGYNQYPYRSNIGMNRPFCKQCGQRIYQHKY